ncbi:MAG: hypothetical protein EXX96DRAFT_598211 [Benjaminiella poitrasii]|nr:MAG: hypothetical protein EXX96DRAFT_598211 [Benjaminiella poitrasii]
MSAHTSYEDYPIKYQEAFSLINVFEKQAQKYADQVYVRYYGRIDGGKHGYKNLTYAEVDRVATNLACQWKNLTKGYKTIAFIADQSVQYFLCVLACLKLRLTFLALSPRNSEAAVANLLTKTDCHFLFTTNKYASLAKSACAQVENTTCEVLPSFDLCGRLKQPLNPMASKILDKNFSEKDIEEIVAIIHSYHMSGFMGSFNMSLVGGSNVYLPKFPPSAREVLMALSVNKATHMLAPPLIIDQLIPSLNSPSDWAPLQNLKYIVVIGAELNEKTGDFFHSNKVNICNVYGMTEINFVMACDMRKRKENKWIIMTPMKSAEPYIRWEPVENEPKQRSLIIRGNSPALATGVANRADGDYDTNDLFMEIAEGTNQWRYLGRKDDTLAMKNGEKTNPVPMESAIRASPIVKLCTVIGEGRECTASLIELDRDHAFSLTPQQMMDEVYAAVAKANKDAPSHSHLLNQMVYILPFDYHLPHTDKGTVPRKKAIRMYSEVIDKLYKDFIDGPAPVKDKVQKSTSSWTADEIDNYISQAAAVVLHTDPNAFLKDTSVSLFDLGLNSLLSIQLRNRIAQSFDNVPQNFLFEHPTIESMRTALMSGAEEAQEDVVAKHYMETEEILEKYIRMAKNDFAVAKQDYTADRKQVVLLTGATGAVGSFILRDLLQSSDVQKVYCLVRGRKGVDLMGRIREGFVDRMLDTSLLQHERIEALPMNLEAPFLGFSEDLYNKLKSEVTVVQACAWLLDFNQPVTHYDKECLVGFYNLLKFAYKEENPMHFHHVSSITATAKYGEIIPEDPMPHDPYVAMPMGYGQSKYICEHLMTYLASEKNFPCYIERLGQVCGDSANGAWNTTEQFPTMIVSGGTLLHQMPEMHSRIDWIPLNYAATTIASVMLSTANANADAASAVFHVVNPNEVMWSDILVAMKQCGMEFDVVSTDEWVRNLKEHEDNPCYKLLPFYENAFKDLEDCPHWNTEKTIQSVPLLAQAPSFNSSLLTKYINYWRKEGFCN